MNVLRDVVVTEPGPWVVTEPLVLGRTGSRGRRGDQSGVGTFPAIDVGVRAEGVGCLGGVIRTRTKGDNGGTRSSLLPLSALGGDTL